MDYFSNKYFNIGMMLIFLAGGMTILFGKNATMQLISGIFGLIGFVIMLFGIKQMNGDKH